MTPEERRAYQQAWRASNRSRVKEYRERRKEADRKRYQANRETHLARQKAYYHDNREARLEYARVSNERNHRKTALQVMGALRIFECLPEAARTEYAEWLMLLADNDTSYASMVRSPRLDYQYLAAYIE